MLFAVVLANKHICIRFASLFFSRKYNNYSQHAMNCTLFYLMGNFILFKNTVIFIKIKLNIGYSSIFTRDFLTLECFPVNFLRSLMNNILPFSMNINFHIKVTFTREGMFKDTL